MSGIPAELRRALEGRYLIERELGRGGMATVYLAQDLRHGRWVALKLLNRELAYALGPARFLREIQLAARLQHPHILTVLDSGSVEAIGPPPALPSGQPWYAMPYVEGESLRQRLRRETQLALAPAIDIIRQVAAALEYAHGHGVVHRDIKPENILLTGDQALVADFGIAKASRPLEARSSRRLACPWARPPT